MDLLLALRSHAYAARGIFNAFFVLHGAQRERQSWGSANGRLRQRAKYRALRGWLSANKDTNITLESLPLLFCGLSGPFYYNAFLWRSVGIKPF